jgi:DNA mismatch repair ATPase MutS
MVLESLVLFPARVSRGEASDILVGARRRRHMSATSTIILEEIRSLEEELKTATGDALEVKRTRLEELKRNFNSATQALTEGRSLLKG